MKFAEWKYDFTMIGRSSLHNVTFVDFDFL